MCVGLLLLFLPWNIKGNCDFISDTFFLAIVNLQYLTILIKSELQDVNFQFKYRSPNCEKKRPQICFFTFFCHGNKLA